MAESNVSVRFSVQDAETVRQALEKLGADGQKALDKLNAAGSTPSQGLKAVSATVEDLKSRATGLAFSLGPVGTGLVALGPAGLLAGAGLGAIALAIGYVIDEANRLGTVSQGLRSLSETTGLTGTALQALTNTGGELGIESEKITAGLSRFTAQLDQVHQAAGPLYDQILKVNPAIADQMVRTRDAATAWNLLSQAIAQADTNQRAAIANVAFGRGNIGLVPLALANMQAGGVGGLTAQSSNVLTDDQIKRFAELKSKIDETTRTAKDLMASIWTEDVLQRELQAAAAFERIAKAAKDLKDQQSGLSWLDKLMDNIARADMAGAGVPYPSSPTKITVGTAPATWAGEGGAGAYTPAASDKETAEATLNKLRQQMSILGSAATSTELLTLKQAELNAAVEKAGGQYKNLGDRAYAAYQVQIAGSDLQIKVANNVATADQLRAQRAAELRLLVASGKLTQDQATQSLQAYEKVVEQTIEQEKVRAAALPQLQQLINSTSSLRGELDTFATDSSKNIGSAFVDLVTGAKSASDAFKNLEAQVIKSLANMLVEMMIVKPIAQGLQFALGSLVPAYGGNYNGNYSEVGSVGPGGITGRNANGNAFSGGNVIPFAAGGIIRRPTLFAMANGGTGLAGEVPGSEEGILPLTRIGGKLGVYAAGGGGAPNVVVNVINAPAGMTATAKATPMAGGGVSIDVILANKVKSMMQNDLATNGDISQSIQRRFGLDPTAGMAS